MSPGFQPTITPGSSSSQALSGSSYGTALNPNYQYSQTILGDTPASAFGSTNPTQMASAWGLPANAGALLMPTGGEIQTPANRGDLSRIQDAVAMIDLFGKFRAIGNGRSASLSTADVRAAERFGGDIGRAAQLSSARSESVRTKPGSAKRALSSANLEIAKRLQGSLGIDVGELTKQGLDAPVPKEFAGMMQNAGYGTRSNMTFQQALDQAAGQGSPSGLPSKYITSNQTVAQYIQALTNGSMSPEDIWSLQKALYKGGHYDESYTDGSKLYTRGQLDVGTIGAFRNAILQTLQWNSNPANADHKRTLEQTIVGGKEPNILGEMGKNPSAAALNESGSSSSGSSSSGATKTPTIPLATSEQLQAPLESAMETYLGRKPNAAELNQFTSMLDGLETSGSAAAAKDAGAAAQAQSNATGLAPGLTGAVDYSTGIPFINKVPTASQAAASWVQNQDPTEYQGHNMADTFGMLMNLIDRQGTSAMDTVGARPNTTQ